MERRAKANALGKVNGIAQKEQAEPAKMTEEDWPGKKMRSSILMDDPTKSVFKQRETDGQCQILQKGKCDDD